MKNPETDRRHWLAAAGASIAWWGGLLGARPAKADAGARVSLPVLQAWRDGARVDYVSTDTSDADMARAMGINHVPLLRHAARSPGPGQSLVERVYLFVGGEQINVFPSAPRPVGPDNADRSYSPLWRVVRVRWKAGVPPQELRFEEAVLDAEERGQLTLEITDVVINCPVVRDASGAALRGVA